MKEIIYNYDKLNDSEINETVIRVKSLLINSKNGFETTDELQAELYGVVKKETDDPKEIKKLQKRYFQVLYNMMLGKDNDSKMGLFLSTMDYNNIEQRLKKENIKVRSIK